jgi:hypothetical protein
VEPETNSDSTMVCSTRTRLRAPMAFATPISTVRSARVAKCTLAIPTPPISSVTVPATPMKIMKPA